jgi:DNA-binding MarR family transcriptional regulator
MELVAYAIEQILSEYSYTYADLLKAYTSGQVRLLKAIAKEGSVKEVLAGDFISTYRLRAASSVSAALKKLLENELVYHAADGYMVYDRFMGEWLWGQVF